MSYSAEQGALQADSTIRIDRSLLIDLTKKAEIGEFCCTQIAPLKLRVSMQTDSLLIAKTEIEQIQKRAKIFEQKSKKNTFRLIGSVLANGLLFYLLIK